MTFGKQLQMEIIQKYKPEISHYIQSVEKKLEPDFYFKCKLGEISWERLAKNLPKFGLMYKIQYKNIRYPFSREGFFNAAKVFYLDQKKKRPFVKVRKLYNIPESAFTRTKYEKGYVDNYFLFFKIKKIDTKKAIVYLENKPINKQIG